MSVLEDIIAKLMAEAKTKIDFKPAQSDINILKKKLCKKYGFLIIVMELSKYRTIIKNP